MQALTIAMQRYTTYASNTILYYNTILMQEYTWTKKKAFHNVSSNTHTQAINVFLVQYLYFYVKEQFPWLCYYDASN